MSSDLTYFAEQTDSKKFINGAFDRIRRYRTYLTNSGRSRRMLKAWSAAYGYGPNGDKDTTAVRPGGGQGELTDMATNDFATMKQHAMVLITQSKPAFKCIAANTDYKTMSQAQLGDSILDDYDRKINVSEREYDTTDCGVLLSEGWITQRWNQALGEQYGVNPQTGKVEYAGDVQLETLTPFDIAYDPDTLSFDDLTWIAMRRRANKWDLAARYPLMADKILRIANSTSGQPDGLFFGALEFSKDFGRETDQVRFWELRHLPSPACPKGRLAIFIDENTCLFDSANADGQNAGYPYEPRDLHCYPFQPDHIAGRKDGHTGFFDLLSMQEFINTCVTIASSNINAGGLQNLYVKRGSNISVDQMAGGLNILYGDSDPPQAIDGVKLSPEVMSFGAYCKNVMRERVGVSDIVMGNAEKGMPAQLAALLEAKAIQFASKAQSAYYKLIERNRTGIIKLLQRFASTKRIAMIAGQANQWQVKEFTSKDLEGIRGISVEAVNPIMKTLAGKTQLADKLLEAGHIKPDQYVLMLTTGRMEPLYENENANLMRIRKEKELLQRGIGIPAFRLSPDGQPTVDPSGLPMLAEPQGEEIVPLAIDTHWLDISEASAVVAQPDVRHNQQVVEAVTRYIDYKQALWDRMSVNMQMLRGCPQGLIRQPAAPQSVSSQPPTGGVGGPSPDLSAPLSPPTSDAGIHMPSPPPNPLTGEKKPPSQPPTVV